MKTIDLFGNEHKEPDVNICSEAWIEGWDWYMWRGYRSNPYIPLTPEYKDWDEGFDAAKED